MNQRRARMLRRLAVKMQGQKHTSGETGVERLGTGQRVYPNTYWRRIYRKLKEMKYADQGRTETV